MTMLAMVLAVMMVVVLLLEDRKALVAVMALSAYQFDRAG